MARYFMHLRDGTEEVLDEEGTHHESLDAMRKAVMRAARDLVAADLQRGVVDLRFRIDAENDQHEIVYTLPFKHAFSLIPDDTLPDKSTSQANKSACCRLS
jgi:hypothetical protein